MKFLTHDGTLYFWQKAKNYIDTKLGEKANSNHKHGKSDITDFPTSLPANGGAADTAKGLIGSSTTGVNLNTLTTPMIQYCNDPINNPAGTGNGMIIVHRAGDIVYQEYSVYSTSQIFQRRSLSPFTNFTPWTCVGNGGNADTVDNMHVDLAWGGTHYGLKPIGGNTTDLKAGVDSLATGYIYIMYE